MTDDQNPDNSAIVASLLPKEGITSLKKERGRLDLKFGIQSDYNSSWSDIKIYNKSGVLTVIARLSFEELFRLKKKIDAEVLDIGQRYPNLFKKIAGIK